MSRIYNSKKGVLRFVNNLENLATLLDVRQAAFLRDEQLDVFYILGRYKLTRKGGILKMVNPLKDKLSVVPDVLSSKEIMNYVDTVQNLEFEEVVINPNLKCTVCHKGWNIDNIHEAVIFKDSICISLDELEGKTFTQVLAIYNSKNKSNYSFTLVDNQPLPSFVVKKGNTIRVEVTRLYHSRCKNIN